MSKGQFNEGDRAIRNDNIVIHTCAQTHTYTEYSEVRQRKISRDLNMVTWMPQGEDQGSYWADFKCDIEKKG